MQNYMEQSPSSLNLLSRKQSLWSFSVITQGLVSHPFCSVTEYSEDTLQVLCLALLPFTRALWGFVAANVKLQQLFGHYRESWTQGLSQLPAKAATQPSSFGVEVPEGTASPCHHSLGPQALCTQSKAKSHTGLPFVPQ